MFPSKSFYVLVTYAVAFGIKPIQGFNLALCITAGNGPTDSSERTIVVKFADDYGGEEEITFIHCSQAFFFFPIGFALLLKCAVCD